jgi:tripartite-type tricarboxylate transporter receptor subunit TctC
MKLPSLRALLAGLVLSLSLPGLACAAWPSKPVRILVGWAPGGATDVVARLMAQHLSDALGQQFIVENRPGAGGNIAANLVAHAPADGSTFIFLTSAHAINATLYRHLTFDPVKNFDPVAVVGFMTQIFVVNPKLPLHSVQDVIAAAKAKPGKLVYASAGSGSSSHLAVEQLCAKTGIDLRHIPYKGTSQYLSDLVAGRVDMAIDSSTALLPLVKNGKLRALAVTSSKRSALLPDLPTVAESGVPGYGVNLWFGFLGPAGLPPEVLAKMNSEVRKLAESPEIARKLEGMGMSVAADYTPAQFRKLLKDDIKMYAKLIKASGAKID